jgi:DNA repair protein RecO (recombination protein O)
MSDYKTEVIILRSWKSKEYDRIYSVFSREHGKMRVVGIGTRRPKAKLASGLEPFTRSDIFLVKCRYLDRVKGTIVLRQYVDFKNNLDYLIEGQRVVNILEKLLPDAEANEVIFVAMKDYLKILNSISTRNQGIKNIIEEQDDRQIISQLAQLALIWKVIYHSGYFPRFYNCTYCNKKIAEQDKYIFILSQGISCGCQIRHDHNLQFTLDKNIIKLIRFLVTQDIVLVKKLKIKSEILQDLKKFTRLILEQITEKKIIL